MSLRTKDRTTKVNVHSSTLEARTPSTRHSAGDGRSLRRRIVMQRKALGMLATTLTFFAVGCGVDGPSAPTRAAPTALDTRVVAGARRGRPAASVLDTVSVLRRIVPLRSDIVQTAVIGPSGGDLRLGTAGVVVHFPAGAVAVPTTITMTAHAGWQVAYDFEPHGIKFAQPVTITQDLRKTLAVWSPALLNSLEGDYFDDSTGSVFLDPWKLVATVKEHLDGSCDRRAMLLTFQIHHFSGYLVSSGRSGGVH